jgi:hypothetical protein
MITLKIGNCPKSAVLVSPQAEMIEIVLDSRRVRRMKSYQLKEVLRWEAEPYTTVPAAESLVGFEVSFETGEEQMPVWVSIIPAEDYRSLKKIFAAAGLKLKNVYPPDVCFPLGAMFAGKEKEMLVIDLGEQTMKFALIEDGEGSQGRTLPAETGRRAESAARLKEKTGSGAGRPGVSERITAYPPAGGIFRHSALPEQRSQAHAGTHRHGAPGGSPQTPYRSRRFKGQRPVRGLLRARKQRHFRQLAAACRQKGTPRAYEPSRPRRGPPAGLPRRHRQRPPGS